ncbi:DNA adenine methylase [Lactobacillus sp. PSON]|uniref:DNA adenine methylase n=1 Tax=Lactobacillus sp. PSON TaxID=3455454 RepID=UPI00404174D1
MKNKNMLKPVIKWVGGKRQLLPKLMEFKPKTYNRYFEPFIGGGALLFALQPKSFVINDQNADLINMYSVVKNNPIELLKLLNEHQKNNKKEYYLAIRALDRDMSKFITLTDVQRAARLIYMLKVDFNGLYRVNKKGQFNVPYGRYKNPKIADSDNINEVSNFLNATHNKIMNVDFEKAVMDAKENDFIYFDPPYIPLTETSDFTSYTSNGFNIKDQERLRDTFFNLSKKGVKVMLSNSDTPTTRELYASANLHEVQASRAINSVASKRGKVGELIITNY